MDIKKIIKGNYSFEVGKVDQLTGQKIQKIENIEKHTETYEVDQGMHGQWTGLRVRKYTTVYKVFIGYDSFIYVNDPDIVIKE